MREVSPRTDNQQLQWELALGEAVVVFVKLDASGRLMDDPFEATARGIMSLRELEKATDGTIYCGN